MIETRARLIAFYLPQYHPIPENDLWWGKGFTEWTNVAKARPLFAGHYQPHLPADLGFYDLRLPETRHAQAELAREYGVTGFCYYHYWFGGKRLLERPFDEVLASGEPDFPFTLCWANEPWSRRWLGEERDVLQSQTYSAEDDLNHIRWLMTAFADRRYIRVGGRPLFMIYSLRAPDAHKRTTDIFRTQCLKNGLPEPYLVGVDAHYAGDTRALGFDATLSFEPQLGVLPEFLDDERRVSKLRRNLKFGVVSSKLKIYDYCEARRLMLGVRKDYPVYPSIFVSWDNTPRRGENGIIIVNSTPKNFEAGLRDTMQTVRDRPYDERLIFIDAWNEWAEGNHLEPDMKYGHQYLEVVKRLNTSRGDRER